MLASGMMDLMDCDANARTHYAGYPVAVTDALLDSMLPREVSDALRMLAEHWRHNADASQESSTFAANLVRVSRCA